MTMRPQFLLLLPALLLAGQFSQAADPDPTALLSTSAAVVENAESASLDVIVTMLMAQKGQSDEMKSGYHYARLGEAMFSFVPVAVDDMPIGDGITARSDGELILIKPLSLNRYTLDESAGGFAEFVRSPFAQGIGNPLGGLGLSVLSAPMAEELAGRVTSSEYLGEEALAADPAEEGEENEGDKESENPVLLHHCRYNVDGQFSFDAWFTMEKEPRIQRLEADLSEIMGSGPQGQQQEDLKYVVTFDFTNWNTDAQLTADDFKLSEPEGAKLVESFFRRQEKGPHPLLGKEAPAFELTNLEGEQIRLADHLGKDVVVLDFWATWCPPCVEALPILDRVTKTFADQGVVFYAIDQGEEAEQVQAFLDKKEISPPVLLDGEGAVSTAYSVEGLPTSILIGKDGTVQVVHVGFSASLEKKFVKELEALVGGENLAGDKADAHREQQAKQQEKLERLRAKLAK